MADVLLVFVREDRVFGDGLRQSLETSGLNVVRCENEFDHNNTAPCILILWSAVSTRSGTLREIAAQALRDGRLVSARIDNCEAPPPLERAPPFDLSQWSGDPDDPAIDPVFFAVDRLVMAKARRRDSGGPAAAPQAPPATTSYGQPGRPRLDSGPAPAGPVTSNYAPIGRRQPDAAPVRAGPVGGRPAAPPPSPEAPPNLAEEALAWRSIEHSTDPTDYLNFLQDFGAHGTFAELAQFKLDKLTKAGKPAANAFIQHKPSPHVEPPRQRPAPRPAAPPPEMRAAPEPPPWREPPPQERIAAAERDTSPRARRSVSGRPRRRVAEAALEPPIRHEPRGGGAPWAPILFVLLLAGGGFAYLQMQPKKTETAAATQTEAAPESERSAPSQLDEPTTGNRTTLAAAYERAGPLASAPAAPAARAPAAPRERQQVATATTTRPENQAYTPPPISYQPPAEATPTAPSFTAPPTVIAPTPQPPVATPAPAAAPAPVESNYPVVIWQSQPSAQNRADAYPTTALSRNASGQAILDCEILPTTRLKCAVVSETPGNLGFGRAALSLAPRFQALPVSTDGRPVIGKRVKIPVRFQAPQ